MELLIIFLIIAIFLIILSANSCDTREHASDIRHSQHLGFGAYPQNLYGTSGGSKYYTDLGTSMESSDDYGAMAGLEFPSFSINKKLGKGKYQTQKVNDYL